MTRPVPARRPPVIPAVQVQRHSRTVVCPACRETLPWDDNPQQVFEWVAEKGRYQALDLSTVADQKRRLRLAESYVQCPHLLAGQTEHHYLPATYHRNGDPITIGLVGRAFAGKTHLVVAMLADLFAGAGVSFGLTDVRAVDQHQHVRFEQQFLGPFAAGNTLDGTVASSDGVQGYLEAIQVRTPRGPRTISFFDIAGDEFAARRGVKDSEFLVTVNAVLYIESVDSLDKLGNDAITGARTVLEHNTAGADVPAAIVLTKADQQRYTEPLDRWLREPPAEPPWNRAFDEETRDLYGWLDVNHATYLKALIASHERCTLHAASATGGVPENGRFPRGVRPTRVLEPLVALLAALGVLGSEVDTR